MPIKLEVHTKDLVAGSGTYKMYNLIPGKEDQEFDLPFTNMEISLSAQQPVTMVATALVMNLDMLLEAINLAELNAINLFMICPRCREKMEQLSNGDWLCGCETNERTKLAEEHVDG